MQFNDEKKEKLDRLERKLYSRNTPNIIDKGRTELNPPTDSNNTVGAGEEERGEVKENWQGTRAGSFDELAAKVSNMAQKKNNFVKKIFIFSILFFLLASGVAAFVFFGGMNLVSSKNVDIKITGPLSVGGGQEASFDISVVNSNNVDLNSASLLVEYPAGTRSANDLSKELDRERFVLDQIKSGESYNQNIKAVLFGEKDSLKQIKISLEYRVENSSALFYKEKIHEISISSAPVIITPTYPKEVNSGQEISFNIEIASNSKDKINDFLVNVEYPFGFVFKESSPNPSFNKNTWKFSSLNSGEKRTISIRGNVIGQDNEEKVFRINAGSANKDDERVIGVSISQLMESILIKKSFIGLDVFIEGESGNFVARGGSQVVTEFTVRNNLPTELFNISVSAAFKGAAFNKLSIAPSTGGFFQSSNNTILWDKRSIEELSNMVPGFEKRLSFSLSPLLYTNVVAGAKPEIEITITAKGERILESGSVELISATETRKISLATDISLSSKSVRSIGNIENSGPIPPKVDVPTTYTVVWNITNSFNQVSNVEVRAALPSYVKWTNLKNPESEALSFNQVTNEVVWNVGSVLPNTGFGSSKKEVYFQLELLPSSSQIGQPPVILGASSLSGIDKATGLKIETKAPAVTTNFSSDPSFKTADDRVVP
mgnify:FL=1